MWTNFRKNYDNVLKMSRHTIVPVTAPVAVVLVWLFLFVSGAHTFNIDSENYAIYGGSERSMFGFSVAIHKENERGWLIVGAPEAQSNYQRRVYHGGAIYKCPIDRDGGCNEVPFDTKEHSIDSSGQQMDNKTEQWFGATLSVSGRENGPIVACAPRYTWYPRKKTRRDPVGTCYVSNGEFSVFNEYSPCRTYQWGYHRQGSCQAGFSAAINSVGDRLFIGSPGSWYWQGQMYSIDAHAEFEYKPRLFSGTYGSEGQVHQQSLENRPAVFSTTEGTESDDDSYMGYSTIVGQFGDEGEEGIAVGMPRGNDLKGKVLLFAWNLTHILHHFSSDQLGSYYGYCLTTADVDGDGKTDLIVGAPLYTLPNTESKYDVGRVYVIYHSSHMGRFVATYTIDGHRSRSRFGQALASLKDINQDGYEDFAVGAPYDGPNERGAVYIYHGSAKGVRKRWSQMILAEDVIPGPTGYLSTFGFSVTGGLDLDGNEYPDMAVGAYLSNNAFFFRSKPVVGVNAHVKFLTTNKEVDIKQSNHRLKDGSAATTTVIDFCVRYHGKNIPPHIDLNLQYKLDTKKPKSSRMGFVELEGHNTLNETIRLYKDRQETCVRKQVYVKSDIRDKLTPLVAEVKYWMQNSTMATTRDGMRNPRSLLHPILDLNSPPSRKDSISVHKECGSDNICIPDLNLKVTPNVDQYLLGSTGNLSFEVIVSNVGEDSFETILEVKYPESVYYSRKDDPLKSHVLCNTYEQNVLKCEIGNPIPKNKVVRFTIYWQPNIREGMEPSYEFDLSVNSTNAEIQSTIADNHAHVSVAIWSNSSLELTGKSYPAEIYFNSSLYTEDISIMKHNIPFEQRLSENAIGPQVTHVYNIRNEGPATIKEAEIFFVWPSLTLAGHDFLYLLEPPQFLPNHHVQCDSIVANHLNFNIERSKKSIWERLHLESSSFEGLAGQHHHESTHHITSVVGGGVAKNEEALNAEVASSGDASLVHQRRQNASQFSQMSSMAFDGMSGEITAHSLTPAPIFKTPTNRISGSKLNHQYGVDTSSWRFEENVNRNTVEEDDDDDESDQHSITGYYDSKGNYVSNNAAAGVHAIASSSDQVGWAGNAASGNSIGITTLDLGDLGQRQSENHEEGHSRSTSGRSRNAESSETWRSRDNDFRSGARWHSGSGSSSSTGAATGATTYSGSYVGSNIGYGTHDSTGNSQKVKNSSGGYSQNSQDNRGGSTSHHQRLEWSSSSYGYSVSTHKPESVGRDNVPTDRPSKEQHFYGKRRKRRHLYTPYKDVASRFPCDSMQCSYMRCVISQLQKDVTVAVALRGRVNAAVLRNISSSSSTTFSTIMATRISKLPYIGQPKDQEMFFNEIISTVSMSDADIKPDAVPLWVVILSAVAGTIILLLLVLILYKAGFFKRNRPSNTPERQPLNRNGYHHGDEAL